MSELLPPGIEGMDIYIGVALTLFILERVAFILKSKRSGNGNGLKVRVTQLVESVEKLEELVGKINDKTVENSVKIEFLIREKVS